MPIDLLLTGLIHGSMLALMAFGIMIPFRILNCPDLSAEGAYPFSACICALSLKFSIAPHLSIFIAMFAGGLLSLCVSEVSLRLKIPALLSGVIISTMAYSINLRILGKSNIALFHIKTMTINLYVLLPIVLLCLIALGTFLHTDYGLRLQAVGKNKQFARNHNISTTRYSNLGLFMAGCLYGLTGGLMVHTQQYVDIAMGVGIAIHALAGLMIGEYMIGTDKTATKITAPIIGALVYQQIQGVVLSLGLAPSDLKLFTAAIVLLILSIPKNTPSVVKKSNPFFNE